MSTHNICFGGEIRQEFRGRRHRTCWRKSHRSHNQNVVIKYVYFTLSSAYLENWVEKNVDKVPSGAHIFQASPIPSNGYIIQPNDNGTLT